MILVMQNPTVTVGVAERIAAQTAARRTKYANEVRALLDAALTVMTENGAGTRVRVADIVATAGLSNDAFYRHFASKDALVAALVEYGAERVAAAVERRMAGEDSAEEKIRRWLDGMISQVTESHAAMTLAVLANSTNYNTALPSGNHAAKRPLAELLEVPLAMLACQDPALRADLITHGVLGRVSGHLWAGTRPDKSEVEALFSFCMAVTR